MFAMFGTTMATRIYAKEQDISILNMSVMISFAHSAMGYYKDAKRKI